MPPKAGRATPKQTNSNQFGETFAAIKSILQCHSTGMRVLADKPGNFALETADAPVRSKPVYFAGVQVRKNYVSLYFMPVYCSPALRKSLSPELRQRMQGKACFNFAKPEPALLQQMEELVKRGAEFFRTADWKKILGNASCD